jgi:putative acetyltransferase
MARMNVRIREETPTDIAAIEAVTIAAFREAPHRGGNEHRIVDVLRSAGRLTLSLVAEDAGVVIAHAAASPVAIAGGADGWFGLGPVSVAPENQRRGIGTLLVHEVLRRLAEAQAAGCVVVGEPAFYGRFGFRRQAELVLPGVPPEYFQAIAFRPGMPRGVVSYDAAFTTPAR